MSDPVNPEIVFDLIKSPAYRTAHIDGAFGGITTKGKISIALFSERQPIPTSITHALDGNKIGKELGRETRQAIIRELEVNCIMDPDTARAIAEWLNAKAEESEKAKESIGNDVDNE
ncbi:MAG: hypothetical protein HYV27_08355 [Candidatus Hydrogenedentes bacterium]|nr:hypothetical protein [Candidatus Hydrogenedentota bacterium]